MNKTAIIAITTICSSLSLVIVSDSAKAKTTNSSSTKSTVTAKNSEQQAAIVLNRAFEQELTQLQEDKTALENELTSLISTGQQKISDMQQKVLQLTEQLMESKGLSEQFEHDIENLSDKINDRSSQKDLLLSTVDQAEHILTNYGFAMDDRAKIDNDTIEQLFTFGVSTIKQLSSIRTESGCFFNAKGRESCGEITKIGEVAAIGNSKDEKGVLIPTDIKQFKIAENIAPVSQINTTGLTPIYLFDPLEIKKRQITKKSLLNTIQSGGIIVWPILGLGAIALLILLERIIVLMRVHTNSEKLTNKVSKAIQWSEWDKAFRACQEKPGAVSRVLMAALRYRDLGRSGVRDAVNEAILNELALLERFLPSLHVIAAVAPLLGLLGTVTGMISTFEVITEFGTGDPKLLSGGISVALVTTELGLIVAIPVLLIHSILTSAVEHIAGEMEQNALKLSLNFAQEQTLQLEDENGNETVKSKDETEKQKQEQEQEEEKREEKREEV